ncbi:MAG: porin [Myxococcales bacterium]|nr:porin [Myxococcales bacterium]
MTVRSLSALAALTLFSTPALAQDDTGLSLFVFADAYGGINTAPVGASYSTTPFHRAYAFRNGFSLSFMGVDAAVTSERFGVTGSLRFGPSVPVFFGGQPADQDGPLGLENLFQLYGTYKPTDRITLDVGQFGTIYGAEVAESWQNLNYTRGALYYAMQPFWHTGVRASVDLTDEVGVTALVVNGVNNAVDENGTPSLGVQLSYGNDTVGVVAGYLAALQPETSADGFHHFGDVVATIDSGDLSVVFNGDVGATLGAAADGGDALWFGGSLGIGYWLANPVGVALRGEFLRDNDNILYGAPGNDAVDVYTGTATLDLRPVPGSDQVILRWDNRIEGSSSPIYQDRSSAASDIWFSSVVGFVVTSG